MAAVEYETGSARAVFERQRTAWLARPFLSYQERRDALLAIETLLIAHQNDIADAAITDPRAYRRLLDTLADAEAKGARVIYPGPQAEPMADLRKIPPALVLDVSDEMRILQEEIFGPLLPTRNSFSSRPPGGPPRRRPAAVPWG